MTVTTALAVFFLIWWVTLFAVLPWGVKSQHESGDNLVPGTDPGAPMHFRLARTLFWTTAVAIVIYGGCYLIYTEHLATLAGLMGRFDYSRY